MPFSCRFLVNATLGSTVSSPLESPDILQRFITANEIGAATTSMASIKLSADSINTKSQQVRPISNSSFNSSNTNNNTTTTSFIQNLQQQQMNHQHHPTLLQQYQLQQHQSTTIFTSSISTNATTSAASDHCCTDGSGCSSASGGDCRSTSGSVSAAPCARQSSLNTIYETVSPPSRINFIPPTPVLPSRNPNNIRSKEARSSLLEFSLSSVGRSFIDGSEANNSSRSATLPVGDSLNTPETPTPNISPSSSSIVSNRCFSETFSNDFIKPSTPSVIVSPLDENAPKRPHSVAATASSSTTKDGSWDLLELDLDFHRVNFDPSFGGDVEERVFFAEDPLAGMLPAKPTEPDSHDL